MKLEREKNSWNNRLDMLKYSDGISSEDSKANQKYFIELDEVKMKYLATFTRTIRRRRKNQAFLYQ